MIIERTRRSADASRKVLAGTLPSTRDIPSQDALGQVRQQRGPTDSVRDAMKMRAKPRPTSQGADQGWAVLSTLISGFVIFGGIGWLLDEWWGTRLMTPIGLIVGMSLGIYAVVMQFGRPGSTEKAMVAAQSTDNGMALRAAKAANRARAAQARHAPSPTDGPPPANTRRETECP